jgi:hypothetical protein
LTNTIPQFSLALFALLGAAPYVAQGFALPASSIEVVESNSTEIYQVSPLGKRIALAPADEWTLVLYDNKNSGGQCGGTSVSAKGTGAGSCLTWDGVKACANIKVTVGALVACVFDFKKESCEGATVTEQITEAGFDDNNVALDATVRFVSVKCDYTSDK